MKIARRLTNFSIYKILPLTLVVFSLFLQPVHANPLETAFGGLAHVIFKLAWPTAAYEDYEVYETDNRNNKMTVKLNGKSRFSDGKLHLWLEVDFDNDYSIEDIDIVKHNAILCPPFKTLSTTNDILKEIERNR